MDGKIFYEFSIYHFKYEYTVIIAETKSESHQSSKSEASSDISNLLNQHNLAILPKGLDCAYMFIDNKYASGNEIKKINSVKMVDDVRPSNTSRKPDIVDGFWDTGRCDR